MIRRYLKWRRAKMAWLQPTGIVNVIPSPSQLIDTRAIEKELA
jgi:hypothetical protein